jgi:phosphoribosylaminoimidazolecarboxamide formyltransferase/IMP cyclohydrolase
MDPDYTPPEIETRQVYGISMQQRRNDAVIDASMFKNVVTKNKEVSRGGFQESALCLTRDKY